MHWRWMMACIGAALAAPVMVVQDDSSAATPAALQQAEMSSYERVVLGDGPVGYWRLDETTGTLAADTGPNRLHATYEGSGVLQDQAPAVGDGRSVFLDGADGFVYVADAWTPEARTLAPTDELSVEVWFRPDSLPFDGRFHQLARWRWYGWGLRILNGRVYGDLWERSGSTPVLTTLRGPQLAADEWYHLVLTKDSGEVRLYLNGDEVASAPSRGPAYYLAIDPAADCCGTGGGVGFGRDADVDTFYFRGWLDEVAVYDTALDATTVDQHHTAGSARPPVPRFLTLDAPMIGDIVDTGDYTVRGRVEELVRVDSLWVAYALDVSNSTGAVTYDCGDPNGNGVVGEVLDCEIAAAVALNSSTAAIPGSVLGVHSGLVAFAGGAAAADVSGAPGIQNFVGPDADEDDDDRERTADFIQAAGSLEVGGVRLFEPYIVQPATTSLDDGLETAFDLLEDKAGRRVVMLVTDHDGTISPGVIQRGLDAGIEVRPFAITPASDRCRAGGGLAEAAEAFGTTCTYTIDPGELVAAFNEPPGWVDRIEVGVGDSRPVEATVDALGNFSADIVATAGINRMSVTAYYADGSVQAIEQPFFAEDRTRIVSMGDSYSAGEGIVPFLPVPGNGRGCHQSTRAYPRLLGTDGYELPGRRDIDIDLDFVACSGAVLKNLQSTVQDARGEFHVVQLDSVDRSADLVTFSIGGNDLGFSGIVQHCALQIQCWEDDFTTLTSGRTLSADEFLTTRLALFLPEVRAFYETLRLRTRDNAAVVAVGYPELFDDGIALRVPCPEAGPFARDERQYLNSRARTFGDLFATEAELAGIWFIDPIEEFKGHRVCDGGINTQSEWIVGLEAAKKIAGDASFHPDDTGAQAYARLISEFLDDRVAEGVPLTPAGFPRNPGAVAPAGLRTAVDERLLESTTVAAPTQAADGSFPELDAASFPTLAQLGLTDAELSEVAAHRFEPADIIGLSALRGDPVCVEQAAPGEQLLVLGHGFRPGSEVTVALGASTESDVRSASTSLVAGPDGLVRASIVVPLDLVSDPAQPEITTVLSVELRGIDGETGGVRRLGDSVVVALADSECAAALESLGDVSPDGRSPAPSSVGVGDVPAPLVFPTFLEVSECFPPAGQGWTLIVGTPGDDTIVGTEGRDLIIAGDGDDVIDASNGADIVCAGAGDDTVRGGNGPDVVQGGAGDDALGGGNGPDTLLGGDGDDSADGGAGADECSAEQTVDCEAG